MPNYSFVQLPGNGVTANFSFNFPYMQRAHISVTVNGVAAAFTWLTSSIVQVSPVPSNGAVVEIRRTTPIDTPVVDYSNGAVLPEADLDATTTQMLYIAQEQEDRKNNSLNLASDGAYDALFRRIKNVDDPTQPGDAASKEYVDAQFASSGGAHAFTAHTDVNPGAAINAGSLVVGNDSTPSKLDTLDVGAKGSILIGKPSSSKRIAWTPVGANYAHLIPDSGKADGLRWCPSHTYTDAEMEMVADGATENYSKLDAGITALPSAGGRLFLGPGTYNFSGKLTVNKPIIVEGCGMGITILQITALVNLQHFFALSRSAIFRNLTIKIQTPSSTDYAMGAIRMDLYGGGVSNQFLICENVETIGFDMGLYADGGGIDTEASLIDYVLYRGCRNTIQTAADLPRSPLTAHRCADVVIENCYSNSNGDGDHCIYAIRNKRFRLTNSRQINSPYHGLKLITNPGDTGVLEQWYVEGNRFDTNDTGIVVSLTNNLLLPQVVLNDNTIKTSAPRDSSPAAVWIVAADTAEMEQVAISKLRQRDCTKAGVTFDIGATATIRHITMDEPYLKNFSTGSSGTYSGISANNSGTVESFKIDGAYFDGGGTGKKPMNLVLNGIIPSIGSVFAKGCTETENSIHPPSARVGRSDDQANLVGIVGRLSSTNVSTTASATEQTLFTHTVKANSLASMNATLRVRAWGRVNANANAKTIRLKWDGNVLISNDVSTTPNGLHWKLEAVIRRVSVAGQRCFGSMVFGSTNQTNVDSYLTVDETAAKTITLTGQPAVAVADEIVVNGVEVEFSE